MNTQTKVQQGEILEARLAGLTYAHIGKRFGVSRQRIHQIIAPPTDVRDAIIKRYEGKCQGCGYPVNGSGHVHHVSCDGENYNDPDNLVLLCISCHRSVHTYPTYCPACGKPKSRQGQFCSRECFSKSRQVEVTCTQCGKVFLRRTKDVRRRYDRPWEHKRHGFNTTNRYFCSKQCQGKWLGTHYGRPKGSCGRQTRLDSRNESIRQHRASGMKYKDLTAMFGLSEGQLRNIVRTDTQ